MLVGISKGPFVFKPGGEPAKKSEYESFTSISKFLECPVLYHDHYARKFKESVSKELIFGRAWHGTVEDALVEKRLTGHNLHVEALVQRWEVRFVMEEAFAREDMEWKGTPSPEQYIETGRGLLREWHRDYLANLKPQHIEVGFWIEMRGCKRALMGKIDLVTEDGLLIDHKTSSKTWKEMQSSKYHKPEELDLQMSIYHGGYQNKFKTWPKAAELHRAVLSSAPEIERIDVSYTVEEVQTKFDKVIKPTIKRIEECWGTGFFPCTCNQHKSVPATAARPLMIQGYAAGTTEGPVEASDSLIDKVNAKAKMVREEPSLVNRPALVPPVSELPF